MTLSDRKILIDRLNRLQSMKPEGKTAKAVLAREIRSVENKLAGKKKVGRPAGSKKEKVNRIDWEKVRIAASKL